MTWQMLLSAFGLVFLAELGDKTQLAVLTQTCKYRRPWAVFLGASAALVLVTAFGAVGGQLLARLVPALVIRVVAALGFVVMAVLLGREALKAANCSLPEGAACDAPARAAMDGRPRLDLKAFGATFGLLFVAEMGDKTQLAVFSLAGRQPSAWAVFAGGALALVAVTALAVIGGVGLCRLIPERVLRWVSAGVFLTMGVLIGLGVL